MEPLTFVTLLLLSHSVFAGQFKSGQTYSVVKDSTGTFDVKEGHDPKAVAFGVFNYSQVSIGWNSIDVFTVAGFSNQDQAYAAGFLEGALTQPYIYDLFQEFFWNVTFNPMSQASRKAVEDFIELQYTWVSKQVQANPTDQYWQQVDLVLQQWKGMSEGSDKFAPAEQKLGNWNMFLSQFNPEISDIAGAANFTETTSPFNPMAMMKNSHCSSLVKLTPEGELFSSHVTWIYYSSMLRVFKNYNFNFDLPSTASNVQSHSGYPGLIPSFDDWYTTEQGLAIMETSNAVLNASLYKYCTPKSVPYWIRVTVANRMATSGQDWVDVFSEHNSGTYNNQYMIVDYKLFVKGEPLKPNTLWIAEQIPGWVISADKTDVLTETTYWASYNIPYFPFVYNISGYEAMLKEAGDYVSYTKCPRAQIFARDHHTVTDLQSMKKIMRSNKWQTDPLSLGNACNAISARCDLNANGASPMGATDGKITDSESIKKMTTHAVLGPTWDSQPPFAWTDQWSAYPHPGMVEVFDFDWVDISPMAEEKCQ